MNVIAAMIVSAAATSPASPAPPCAGCTLDAPPDGDAIPMLVLLRSELQSVDDAAPRAAESWRAPALTNGWAVLTLADWEHRDPSWVATQVWMTAKRLPIDLARVYLIGSPASAGYIARHVQSLGETFAALVITGAGEAPATSTCPERRLPVYFLVDANDAGARAFRAYLVRCKHPVAWSVTADAAHGASVARRGTAPGGAGPLSRGSGALEPRTVRAILAWLHRQVRVTTVASQARARVDLRISRVMLARCDLPSRAPWR